MKQFLKALSCVIFFATIPMSSNGADVRNTPAQTVGVQFGSVAAADISGAILTDCTATNGVKAMGGTGCTTASFLVTACDTGSGTKRRTIKVFIPATMSVSGTPGSVTAKLSLNNDLAGGGTGTQNKEYSFASGSSGTITVPVYSSATIPALQADGTYASGTYSIVFCRCSGSGCPSTSGNSNCTNSDPGAAC